MIVEKSCRVKVFIFCYIASMFILVPISHATDADFGAIIEKIPFGIYKYWYFLLIGLVLSSYYNNKFRNLISEIPTTRIFFLEFSGIIVASLFMSTVYSGLNLSAIVHTLIVAIVYCFLIKGVVSLISLKIYESRR